MSIFTAMETGKRAIIAQQTALQVTGHNIANAGTTGYTRQVANLETTSPYMTQGVLVGTGVEVSDIGRIRDELLDVQIRSETSEEVYWSTTADALSQIETILSEPTDESLGNLIDSYWQAWEDLANDPSSEATRTVLAQTAAALADTFNSVYNQLSNLADDLNATLEARVTEINTIAGEIASLNKQILQIDLAGMDANDLMDQRDVLLDELSTLVDYDYKLEENGTVTVQIGGRNLVSSGKYTSLSAEADSNGLYMVAWADTGSNVDVSGGEIGAIYDLRGTSDNGGSINDLIDDLNELAKTIIVTTNEVHQSGYSLNNTSGYPDGTDFFTMPADANDDIEWASFISVSEDIIDDVQNIAAASSRTYDENGDESNLGDGSLALTIANLKQNAYATQSYTLSDSLDSVLSFPGSTSGDLTITYGGGSTTTITLNVPAEDYQDLQELVDAIQEQLDANTDLSTAGISITVSSYGNSLKFSSGDTAFEGVSDAGLLGGSTGFSALTSYTGMAEDVSVDDYWTSLTASVGVDSNTAQAMLSYQETLVSELEENRESISGVSLDEEMTNMLIYQHAYNAASRYITTIDEALDKIINGMGVVGR